MKKCVFLSLLFLMFWTVPGFGQTYFYVENINLSPQNPTENDLITMVVSGNLSSTDIVVYGAYLVMNGNTVEVHFNVGSTGMGLMILVPYSHTFTLGPLLPGSYNISINGPFVGDFVPPYQKQFTVTGLVPECDADFIFYPDTSWQQPLSMDVFLFDDLSTGNNIISWYWDFGDGFTSTLQNPQHGFFNLMPAQFVVCLTILTSDSCTDTYCDTINIAYYPPQCNADFIFYPDTSWQQPLSMDIFLFDDLSTGNNIISWYWDFGDGTTSTLQNPQHGYFNMIPAQYVVCLTILTSDSCTDTYCDTININLIPDCEADFIWALDTMVNCINCYDFFDQSSSFGNILSWFWDFGDGSFSSLQNPIHSFNQTGLFHVCLTIITADSCSDVTCQTVVVGDTATNYCQADFSFFVEGSPIPEIMVGHFTDESNSNASITSWSWNFGDGNTSSVQNPSNSYWLSNWGLNTVCLTITTSTGCTDSICKPVYVGYDGCMIAINYTVSEVTSPGGSNGEILLNVMGGTAPYQYYWSNGATSQNLTNIPAGIYVVWMVDAANCILNEIIEVTESPLILTQTITFPSGWSIFSTYIESNNPNIADVLQPLGDTVIISKNGEGQVYWPLYGFNGIGNMIVGQGYQLKLTGTGNHYLDVSGIAVVPQNVVLSLPANWSIIGYLRQSPGNVEQMFAPLISLPGTAGLLHIAKDDQGNVYWPFYGLNLIGSLQPGKGYQVKMNSAAMFSYPPN
ncbi:MAG: PKD domain-containing protein [Bacteroidales bacterium]|nr:PKD domain-containing protein [Bacteroidales bacterium]MCF8457209.1 PKD domain-containing protein [Bacteroidales bacterium]